MHSAPMTADQYKSARTLRGTQTAVAAMLGVHQVTIARRETGSIPITREAEIALLALPTLRPVRRRSTRRA